MKTPAAHGFPLKSFFFAGEVTGAQIDGTRLSLEIASTSLTVPEPIDQTKQDPSPNMCTVTGSLRSKRSVQTPHSRIRGTVIQHATHSIRYHSFKQKSSHRSPSSSKRNVYLYRCIAGHGACRNHILWLQLRSGFYQ
jgi:hypothetical protein